MSTQVLRIHLSGKGPVTADIQETGGPGNHGRLKRGLQLRRAVTVAACTPKDRANPAPNHGSAIP